MLDPSGLPVPPHKPPYYMAVLTIEPTGNLAGYPETAQRMDELVKEIPGFLGLNRAGEPDGLVILVGYFRDEDAIAEWRNNAEHLVAQRRGREEWCKNYSVHVAKVERSYGSQPPPD